jgi:4-aminobutyrate aminotransferase-like enzyme
MNASRKKKTVVHAARLSKKSRTRKAGLDPRLHDAEQFLLPTYKRQPFLLTHGKGCYLYDSTGKKYQPLP